MIMQSIRQCSIIFGLFFLLAAIGGCGETSVPSAPTGLAITSTVSQNTLSWNAVSGCSYNIYRGSASNSETLYYSNVNSTKYVDVPQVSSTIPGSAYYYVVTAVNSVAKSGFSNEVSVTPPNLRLGTVTSSSVNLSWTTVSWATRYNIYRSTGTDEVGLPALSNSLSTSYTDTPTANGVTYHYRVTAVGQNGYETLGSNKVSATP